MKVSLSGMLRVEIFTQTILSRLSVNRLVFNHSNTFYNYSLNFRTRVKKLKLLKEVQVSSRINTVNKFSETRGKFLI